MSEILYFTHFTNIDNFLSMLKSGYLYTNIERIQNKIKYEGVASAAAKEKMIYKDKDFSGEFPGIYLSYITENNLKRADELRKQQEKQKKSRKIRRKDEQGRNEKI